MKRFASLIVLLMTSLVFAQPTPEPTATIGAIEPGQSTTLTITLDIPDGYHAQSHKPLDEALIAFTVTVTAGDGITVGEIQYPEPQIKTYPELGETSVFGGETVVKVPLEIAADARLDSLSLAAEVTYQICDDEGTCFAPQTKAVTVLTPTNPAAVEATPGTSAVVQRASLFGYGADLTSIWIVVGVGLVVGLLFNVMPCVLPVLPLKVMGFYEASQHHRGQAIAYGAAFSLGLIGVFVALGLLVLLSKSLFGQALQWGQWFSYAPVVWGMTILLVVLGFGMLGAFAVRVPTSLYGLSFRHDTYSGNVSWGALTALLSTPCTAPMFAPVLGWSAAQPVMWGFVAMLSVGVGMALPYFVLSAFPEAARSFPRTGPASELVKQALAFPLLGTAAWLIGPTLVGDPQHWWLVVAVMTWGALFVLIRAAQILKSSTGILVTSAVSVMIVGACVYVAISFSPISTGPAIATELRPGVWNEYSDETLAAARAKGPVIVKFTASWCANCQVIEATVFKNDQTLATVRERGAYLIKADLTKSSAPGWARLNALGQTGIPLTAIYLPGKDQPILLDSLYSSSDLLAALPAASVASGR
jgi:thiol:disulfide interchange protein DsbD